MKLAEEVQAKHIFSRGGPVLGRQLLLRLGLALNQQLLRRDTSALVERISRYGLQSVVVLFFFFAAHRLMAWPFLAEALLAGAPLVVLQAVVVGLASDLWVAALASLLLVLFLSLASMSRCRASLLPLTIGYYLGFALLVSLHQSYVEFFHAPLLAFHLSYLGDPLFVTANYKSLLAPRPLLGGAVLLGGVAWAASRLVRQQGWSAQATRCSLALLYMLATAAHVLNIRYRIQWFVPEALQMNLLESLYTQCVVARPQAQPGEAEWRLLHERLAPGRPVASGPGRPESVLMSLVPGQGAGGVAPTLAELLSQRWQALVREQSKPLLLVLLAESLRAVDSASYGGQRPSLTPHFDELARGGILFRNAWSSGTVTRAGQEAVWCGYHAHMTNSLMRSYTQVDLQCLPDASPAASSFWYHGGEGRFDNQAHFWRKHQVAELMTQADFPTSAARTGWGVGDRTFLQAAAKRIVQRDREVALPYQLGMLLTVSHHIPWELPADAPVEILAEAPYRGLHASERTLVYTDLAMGEFVSALKLAGLWEKTLLIIVGDHGIAAPPLQDLPGERQQMAAVQKSHIALVVSGGIVEALSASRDWPQDAARVRDEHVSQVDIAALLAYIAGLGPGPLMGELPLHGKRQRPVVADLGPSVFFPALGVELDQQTFAGAGLETFADDELRYSVAYYRALTEMIRVWSGGGQRQGRAGQG